MIGSVTSQGRQFFRMPLHPQGKGVTRHFQALDHTIWCPGCDLTAVPDATPYTTDHIAP